MATDNDSDTGILLLVALIALLAVLAGLYIAFDSGDAVSADSETVEIQVID